MILTKEGVDVNCQRLLAANLLLSHEGWYASAQNLKIQVKANVVWGHNPGWGMPNTVV
jgi:hypothetical protein